MIQNRLLVRVAIASALVLTGAAAAEARKGRDAKSTSSTVRAAAVSKAKTAAAARRETAAPQKAAAAPMSERECMARAMYFESDRTRRDGMLAVGTVVANRLQSGRYGETVCAVVGARAQFAPGVLRRPMLETRVAENALKVADAVLAGERHPIAGGAMFFHTANVPFRHDDKDYVMVSGGNAFYRWNRKDDAVEANLASLRRAFAAADDHRVAGEQVVAFALAPKTTEPSRLAVAAEIVTPAPGTLERALAFAEEPVRTPAATAAVAAVAAAALPAKRVIAPEAPVLASAGPSWRSPNLEPSASLLARANAAVAAAWDALAHR